MSQPLILTRHSAPTKQDTAPKGTRCCVKIYGIEDDIWYIQKSENEEDPNWELE